MHMGQTVHTNIKENNLPLCITINPLKHEDRQTDRQKIGDISSEWSGTLDSYMEIIQDLSSAH
jgi:hypothetical protein